jgi:hypothetical protein
LGFDFEAVESVDNKVEMIADNSADNSADNLDNSDNSYITS